MVATISDIGRDARRSISIEHGHFLAIVGHDQGTRQVAKAFNGSRLHKIGLPCVQDHRSCPVRKSVILRLHGRSNVDHRAILHSYNQESTCKNTLTEQTRIAYLLIKALDEILRPQAFDRQHKRSIERISGDVADEHRHRIGSPQHQRLFVDHFRIVFIIGVCFRNNDTCDSIVTHRERNGRQGTVRLLDGASASLFRTNHHIILHPIGGIVLITVLHIGKPKLHALGRVLGKKRNAEEKQNQ